MCWVVGGEVWRVWGKVRRDVGDVKKFEEMCGRVNGVSVGGVGKCAGVRM